LAECIMLDIDLEMQKLTRYVRYVDDIRILGTNELEVLKGINILDTLTRKKGLIPHSGKYGMRKANSKYEAIGKLPSLSSGRTGQNSFTQKRLIATFYKSLSKKKDAILDISSFKFSIYRLYPNEQILNCIMRLIPRYPDLIDVFDQYFVKFGERRKISNYILRLIS